MPLHLLPKKSWNVYNKANIERVRRDEALAKAAEEAEEQRMQEVDAARRLAILRGEAPPPIEERSERSPDSPEATTTTATTSGGMRRDAGDGRRTRKRHGEDDTDFEMRVAKEREAVAAEARRATSLSASSAPIVDGRGHIDLFGAQAGKNEDAERDKARRRREYEDQYTMRFANAAGGSSSSGRAPWYSSVEGAEADGGKELVRKNVWGRDDPKRQERDEKRRDASDPLAAMRRGAAQVRALNRERGREREEREGELRQMRRDEEERRRRRRRRSRSPESARRRGSRPSPESGERSRREAADGRGGARRREDEDRARRGHRDGDRSRDRSRDERRRRGRSHSRERERHGRHDEKRRRK